MSDSQFTGSGIRYEQILARIEEMAPFYAPGWKFDRRRPDFGSALACVFARQLCGSMERFELTPQNHMLAFYNRLGADGLPAVPASGVVCFRLSGDSVEGSVIPKDFKLYSPVMDDKGTRYSFETQRELFVTPAKLKEMIFSDPQTDRLSFWDNRSIPFTPDYVNSQTHRFTFSHPYIDEAGTRSRMYLKIKSRQAPLWLERLSNPALAGWSLIQDGERCELRCIQAEQRLLLTGFPDSAGQRRIVLDALNIGAFEMLPTDGIFVETEGNGFASEAVFANGEEQTEKRFYPFSESFAEYSEVTFLCDPVLRQKGASITMSFTTGFTLQETTDNMPVILPKKFIIAKKDIPKPEITDIYIKNVVWEYYNGLGFAPLPLETPSGHIFAGINKMGDPAGTSEYKLRFVCPDDIEPLLIGSRQGYCIRARVRAVENAYTRPARISIPWMAQVRFDYSQHAGRILGGTLENSGESSALPAEPCYMFSGPHQDNPVLYLGFDQPLVCGSPIGIYICACGGSGSAPPDWQYWSGRDWLPLMADGQTSLTRTSLLSFTLPEPLESRVLFGRGGYWLRTVFEDNPRFRIDSVHMNGTPVLQCDTVTGEMFSVNSDTRHLQLGHQNIIDETVYADEKRDTGASAENTEENWIPWTEAPVAAPIQERQYRIDRARGIITFPHGIGNILEPFGSSVKVSYRYGGGKAANLPANEELMPSLAVGYVRSAVNPLPILGGMEQEEPLDTISRLSKTFRHSGRPVTASDYEDLAWEPGVAKIKCYMDKAGGVTLVVLIRDYSSEHAFAGTQKRVTEKLTPLLPLGVRKLSVLPPIFVEVSVKALLLHCSGNTLCDAYDELRRLCDPLASAEASGFGVLPDTGMVLNTLVALPSVAGCPRLFVRYSVGEREIIEIPPLALPVAGEHILSLVR